MRLEAQLSPVATTATRDHAAAYFKGGGVRIGCKPANPAEGGEQLGSSNEFRFQIGTRRPRLTHVKSGAPETGRDTVAAHVLQRDPQAYSGSSGGRYPHAASITQVSAGAGYASADRCAGHSFVLRAEAGQQTAR